MVFETNLDKNWKLSDMHSTPSLVKVQTTKYERVKIGKGERERDRGREEGKEE